MSVYFAVRQRHACNIAWDELAVGFVYIHRVWYTDVLSEVVVGGFPGRDRCRRNIVEGKIGDI